MDKFYQVCIYPGATARLNAAFGQGIGAIFLDNVRCSGYESRLSDCTHSGLEITRCQHSQDAGVQCIAGIKYITC